MLLEGQVYLTYCLFLNVLSVTALRNIFCRNGIPLPESEQKEIQYKGKYNIVKGKRLTFYRRYPKYISLNLIQSRTLNSLTVILKHADYWTLKLLRTKSNGTSCLCICLLYEIP